MLKLPPATHNALQRHTEREREKRAEEDKAEQERNYCASCARNITITLMRFVNVKNGKGGKIMAFAPDLSFKPILLSEL